ncbi:MAG TPA: caspase family protein, partial [Tenuifilaceae bacterium]|nr:caspase family protein [Tenuifilaceae bacterium]
IKLWDFESGQLIRIFEGHTGGVKSVQFSPDGKYIVSASADGSIKLWDIATGECLITRYDVPNSDDWVAVTPDGRFDGTDAGMKLLYYVKDLEVIPLESFYERFYTPGLAARVFSGSTDTNVKQHSMGSDIKLPPSVRIVSPTTSDRFNTDLVEVVVEATDQGDGVDEARLYQNGKLVSEEQRGFKQVQKAGEKVTKKYSVLLASGVNEFRATAFNTDRTESVPYTMSIELQKAITSSNLYLVAIGVNTYKNAKYSLTYSVADAEAFAQTVAAKSKGIFGSIKTVVLKDEQCTKSGILAQLAELSSAVKPEDVFIFYYAGHGVMSEGSESTPSEFYFVPFDVTQLYGNDDMLGAKGISASELRKALISIKAQKQLIVMDACQSGGATEMLAMRGAAEEKALMQLARSAGIAVLSSTGTEQFASEVKQLGHGVFT